jgi:ABC-2 type transport system ATP-binding protein
MKMLLGLVRPSSGSGSVYGLDIIDESPAVRRRIGYLPQDPKFYGHMNARETLRFAAGFFFVGPKDGIESRVSEMLELVGLSEKDDRPVKTFSGGEMQRLGIAQAQIHKPDLLILDEPAAALDPLGRRDVLAILEKLKETSTVFYSTHILDDVQRVSDAVCILRNGRVAAQGSITELLTENGRTTYEVRARGDLNRARDLLDAEPWVDEVFIDGDQTSGTLRIRVLDANQAEAHLQRLLLADDSLVITEFARLKPDLEDVFISVVEGTTDA